MARLTTTAMTATPIHATRKAAAATQPFYPRLLTLAVAACFTMPTAYALPNGAQVVAGAATISRSGNVLNIANTPGAIINWANFSVGALESVRFQQQSALSSVLNRVTGSEASAIHGALSSNGRVWLINPNGILFGQGARIDIPGFVASTLNISDTDFLAGRLNFSAGAIAGNIRNEGTLNNAGAGNIYLIAPDINNTGIINAPNGEVLLAAGRQISLVDNAHPDVQIVVSAPTDQAVNLGEIVAQNGKVSLFGALLKQKGMISADSVAVDAAGRIVFRGSQTTLDADSQTTARGQQGNGGQISIQSSGDTQIQGQVDASSSQAQGGNILALGHHVAIGGNAVLDTSGEQGGGRILVGGDFQGKNPAIQNAQTTLLGKNATLKANAGEGENGTGKGGTIIVWGDGTTRAYGNIEARGGKHGGDGGFVEVSGKKWLDFQAKVDTSAGKGNRGTLLLDPERIVIGDDADLNDDGSATTGDDVTGDILAEDSPTAVPTLDPSDPPTTPRVSYITAGQLSILLNTSSVSLAATESITVNSDITPTPPVPSDTPVKLSLTAGNTIDVNANIIATTNPLDLELTAGSVNISSGKTINPQYGDVTVNATTGNISIAGNVTNAGAIRLTAENGQIDITNNASLASASNIDMTANALDIASASTLSAADNISISSNDGYDIDFGSSTDSNSAALEISDTEFNKLSAPSISLKSINGSLDVTAAITKTTLTASELTLEGFMLDINGSISSSAGNLGITLRGGGEFLEIGENVSLAAKGSNIAIDAYGPTRTLSGASISSDSGNIAITTTGSLTMTDTELSTPQGSISLTTETSLTTSTGTTITAADNIEILADRLLLSGGNLTTGGTGTLTIASKSVAIDLGTTDDPLINGPMGISADEFSKLSSPKIVLDSYLEQSTGSPITITSSFSIPAVTQTLKLNTGAGITQTAPVINTGAATVEIGGQGNVDLTNAGNQFGRLTGRLDETPGSALQIVNSGNLSIGDLKSGGGLLDLTVVDAGTLTIDGTVSTFRDSAGPIAAMNIVANGGIQITTLGEIKALNSATITGNLTNNGIIDISAGATITGELSNNGTARLSSVNTPPEITGAVQNAANATLEIPKGLTINAGSLSNSGRIELGNGSAAATLQVANDFTQTSTGTLAMYPGKGDVVNVNTGGTATLAGTLELLDDLQPTAAPVQIINAPNYIDTSTNIVAMGALGGYTYNSATGMLSAPTGCMTCVFDTTGDWTLATNWQGDMPPSPGASITIDSNQTATISNNVASIGSLSIVSTGQLTVTGTASIGSLTSLGALVIDSTGQLTVTGTANIASLTLSGGSLTGANTQGATTNNLTVSNAFTQTLGTISGFNSISITKSTGNLIVGNLSTVIPVGGYSGMQAGAISLFAPDTGTGNISQHPGTALGGGAVYASAAGSVALTENNPTGVIAGQAGSSGFAYTSSNQINISQVHGGSAGINTTGDIKLTSNTSGTAFSQNAPIVGAGLALTGTTGGALLTHTGNAFGNFAANLSGSAISIEVAQGGIGNFRLGSVGAVTGINAPNATRVAISNKVTDGSLIVANNLSTGANSVVELKAKAGISIGELPTTTPAVTGKSIWLASDGNIVLHGSLAGSASVQLSNLTDASPFSVRLNADTPAGGNVVDTQLALISTPELVLGHSGVGSNTSLLTINPGSSVISRASGNLALVGNNVQINSPITISTGGFLFDAGQISASTPIAAQSVAGKTSGALSLIFNGNLNVGSYTTPEETVSGINGGSTVQLTASGSITGSAPISGITSLSLNAGTNLGTSNATPLKIITPTINAIASSGSIWLEGHSPAASGTLTASATAASGEVRITNYGHLIVPAGTTVIQGGGAGGVMLRANSPLTVNGGISSGGPVSLTASGSSSTDKLILASGSTISVPSGGSVLLTGGTVSNSASITDPNGTIAPTVTTTYTPPAPPPSTETPTVAPTEAPTLPPTVAPTEAPTLPPTVAPTEAPTLPPTVAPTEAPTLPPTVAPTEAPTLPPTVAPTEAPTLPPTVAPTEAPTLPPTVAPTEAPTLPPTVAPTEAPTLPPTVAPTEAPTLPPIPVQQSEPVQQTQQLVVNNTLLTTSKPESVFNNTGRTPFSNAGGGEGGGSGFTPSGGGTSGGFSSGNSSGSGTPSGQQDDDDKQTSGTNSGSSQGSTPNAKAVPKNYCN